MVEEKASLLFVSAQQMETEMVRGALQAVGIECFSAEDKFIPILPGFYTQEIGSFKVFVRPKDLSEASAILREHFPGAEGPPFNGAYFSTAATPGSETTQTVNGTKLFVTYLAIGFGLLVVFFIYLHSQ